MTSPFGLLQLIVNPRAGRGRGGVLDALTAGLDAAGLEWELQLTRSAGHATELAHRAVTEQDRQFVVAVGGDGTVHEVVNGLVDVETGIAHRPDTVLGVVAGGSGSDFLRTFGLPHDPAKMVRFLATPNLFPIDLGRVRYTDLDGRPATRLFANIAECGWGAEVTRRANGLPRWLGKSRYVAAILGTTAAIKQVPATVTVDHTSITEPLTEVVVANGQFFGGNIKVAPRALPDDGIYNVQLWNGTAIDVLKELPKARLGEHLSNPTVREYQSTTVEVTGEEPMLLEADGEVLGTTPAVFDIIRTPLSMKI